jgi:hypothetical protein
MLSPPTSLTNSPIIGVVATTFNSLPSISGHPASELPPEQAISTNDSASTPNLKIGLFFKILLLIYNNK